MGTILYDFLNDSFLFNEERLLRNFSESSDQQLRSELDKYREFCLGAIPTLLEEVPSNRPNSFLFSGKNSFVSLEELKNTALYVEGHVLDDPLFEFAHEPDEDRQTFSKFLGYRAKSPINRERLCEIIRFLRNARPMVAADYVKFLPLSQIYEPPDEIGLYYSDNYFSDLLSPPIMQFFRNKVVIRSLAPSGNGWKVLENLSPTRGIFITFEGQSDKSGDIYHLTEVRPVHYDEKTRVATLEHSIPDAPPDRPYFDAWTFQSVNKSAWHLFTGIMSEIAISEHRHAMFATNSQFVFDLLGFLGAQTSDIRAYTAQSLFNLDLPILTLTDIETVMKVRGSDGEAFQAFRDALEQGFRVLRGETDGDILKRKTEDLLHELAEVQVRNVDRKIGSLRRSAIAEAGVAILGLAGAIHTAGWSVLAASTAIFQGYKTFEAYRRDVTSNPAYFLWKLRK